MKLLPLLKDTVAFSTVKGDKKSGRLSHAYLIISADKDNLTEYLKIFAKIIACGSAIPCDSCRACRLINEKHHPDVIFYPQNGVNVATEDINDLIEKSYLKPVEGDSKIFILSNAETMTVQAQNKLLKTLEEPPRNVHILIGAASEYPLLPTVRSRVKKLEIPAFGADKIFEALVDDCADTDKLRDAVACGDGTVGKALALYGDESLATTLNIATDTLINMKSSKDVLAFSVKITNSGVELEDFITVTELLLRDMLVCLEGKDELASNKKEIERLKQAKGFNRGALLYALERCEEAKKRKKFNGGGTMLLEWLLFSILEGKHKWLKL